MKLNESQESAVRQWIEDGQSVADIQKRLQEEFEIKMTYMDTRFLIDDLKLTPKDPEPEVSEDDSEADLSEAVKEDGEGAEGSGAVQVTVDQITQPGALVSGKVQFTDGVGASWMLDQMGRLGFDPEVPGYRPSEDDMIAFQTELQNALRQAGF